MKKVYYSIGEVSNLLNLKKHTIRYWESEFKQLKPYHKRGGNRRFTAKDIEVLKRIKHLLYAQKYTIKGVQTLLDSADEDKKFDKVIKSREEIKEEIKAKIQKIKQDLLNI